MLARTLQLINQDKIALYVAFIAKLLALLPGMFLFNAGEAVVIYSTLLITFAEIIFTSLFAAECARQMIVRKKIFVGQTFADTFKRYIPTLFFGVIIPFLAIMILYFVAALFFGQYGERLISAAVLPLGIALGLALVFFPVVYVLSSSSASKTYALLGNYVRKNFRHAFQSIVFVLMTALLFGCLAIMLKDLPYADILSALLGCCHSVFVVYGLVVLFMGQNQVSELV